MTRSSRRAAAAVRAEWSVGPGPTSGCRQVLRPAEPLGPERCALRHWTGPASGSDDAGMGTLPASFLPRADVGRLLAALQADGRRILGPTVRDGTVVYDEIAGPADLPTGWA